jgi:non-specific serine/threonine protein kinase
MLVTIQEFGRERLRDIGDEIKVCNWHLEYFIALAEKGDAEIRGPNQIEWIHRLDVLRDNLHAALQWALETQQTQAALQMARSLHWFFFVRGDHSEGRQWLGRVVAMPDAPLYPEDYAEALAQIAHHTWLQMGPKEARPYVEQALAVAREHGDKWNTANALYILGLVLAHERDYAKAQVTSEESMALFRELDDKWRYAHAMLCLAQVPFLQEDYATALTLHQQALELFRKVGDRYFQSVALRLIGYIQVTQGDWSPGQAAIREALTLAQQLDSKWEIAQGLFWGFAYAAQVTGNPARAVRLFWAARNFFDSISAWQEVDDPEFEDRLATCRAVLSESEFAEAVAQGRAMTMEQAIAYALENGDE